MKRLFEGQISLSGDVPSFYSVSFTWKDVSKSTSLELRYLILTYHAGSGHFSASVKNRSKVGRLKRFSINCDPSRWLWGEWWTPKFTLVFLHLAVRSQDWGSSWSEYLIVLHLFLLGLLRTASPHPFHFPKYIIKDTGEICVSVPSICMLSPFLPPTSAGEGWVFMSLEFVPSELLCIQMRTPDDSSRINCSSFFFPPKHVHVKGLRNSCSASTWEQCD